MEAALAPALVHRFEPSFRHLSGCFTPAALHIEAFHGSHTIPGDPERLQGLIEADTERADHAGSDYSDPLICHVCGVKCHPLWRFGLRDSYCFLNRSILLMSPKPKTKAWKLEDCQLSLFSGDSIRKSEQ